MMQLFEHSSPTATLHDEVRRRPVVLRRLVATLALLIIACTLSTAMSSPAHAAATAVPAGLPALSLPFAVGQSWRAHGTHADNGSSGPKNAIDLSGGDGKVLAAADGTARIVRCSGGTFVVVDHPGNWHTGYYHIGDLQVRDGQPVSTGTWLGNVGRATPCGGFADGAHVHFTLWNYAGSRTTYPTGAYALAGIPIGGWTFTDDSAGRQCDRLADACGTATHVSDGKNVTLPTSLINEGGARYDYSLLGTMLSSDAAGAKPIDSAHTFLGETGYARVTVRNTGTTTWGVNGADKLDVKLGTAAPNDHASAFATPQWIAPHRAAAVGTSVVARGATFTFVFPVRVNENAAATITDRFNLVAEGVAWFPDHGVSVAVSLTKTVDRAVALRHNGPGGYAMSPDGTVSAFGGAPPMTSNSIWPGWDIARGLALRSDDMGGYVLDGWGGIHPFGNAPTLSGSAYWQGSDIARAIVLRSDNQGGYVLDGWGALHPFGNAPALSASAYWQGWDIARAFVLTSDSGGWVLDGYGALHPFGNAPALGDQSGHYWSGNDIARSVASVNGGTGGYVMDGQGGVHAFGNARVLTGPYWSFDVAKALAVAPNGSSGIMIDGAGATHPLA